MKHHLLVGVALLVQGCGGQERSTAASSDALQSGLRAGDRTHSRHSKEDEDDDECPRGWLAAPSVDPSLAVPGDAGSVIVHAAAIGTQDYACTAGTDGGLAWKFVGPEATLSDCEGKVIGRHFASAGGPSAPEWQLRDGYAIGHKVAQSVPDGGSQSIPWLLLQVVNRTDAGKLREATYVQRLNTVGGIAPKATCEPDSGTEKVAYTADYYFYAP